MGLDVWNTVKYPSSPVAQNTLLDVKEESCVPAFSSVQSYDQLGHPGEGRGGMRDDSAEIFFQSAQQEALVNRFGMGKYVHSLMWSV